MFKSLSRFGGWAVFIAAFISPSLVHAESVLNFPRLSFEQDVLTGVAIVNPTAQSADVTITAYGADGNLLRGTGFANPVKVTIAPQQQFVKATTELFGGTLPSSTIGWFQATSPVEELTGFFLFLNSSITLMDGADLPDSSQKCIFNYIKLDSGISTELNIINPSSTTAELQVQLAGSSFTPIVKSISLPPHGAIRTNVADFFQVTQVPTAAYVVVDSNTPIAGFEIVRTDKADSIGLNARPSTERFGTLYFLQLPVLGGRKSQIGLVNYSADPVILTLSALKPDGTLFDAANLLRNPIVRSLPGGGSLSEDVESLFGFFGSKSLDGWLTVKSTSDAVNGLVVQASPSNGSAGTVTSTLQGRTRAIFSHIAAAGGFSTGLTVLNPSSLSANLRVVAFEPSGDILGSFDTVLQPGQRFSQLLGSTDFIPEAANHIGGFVWVKSDIPLYLSCQISAERAVANIPPQDAPANYNPDSALPSLKVKPVLAIVPLGSSQRFQADGATSGLSWKVNGQSPGASDTGTITAAGVFSAPKVVPARQTVTITAETGKQTFGASADILDRKAFVGDLKVIQSVVYLDSLKKIYAAELTALAGSPGGSMQEASSAPSISSQIYEVSPVNPKVPVVNVDNDNITKILTFHASDEKDYLLMSGKASGRIYRLNPASRDLKIVVEGLNEPSSMVLDPVSGDLLVAEKDKITTVLKDTIQTGIVAATPADGGSERDNRLNASLAINGATGISVDRCTGKAYYAIGSEGRLVEYDPSTQTTRDIVTGLLNPGNILGIYRRGVTCPSPFHMLIAERGADRILLVVPDSGLVTEWLNSPGIADIAFLPAGNPYTPNEGILLADYALGTNGIIYIVPLTSMYDINPPNPPETPVTPAPPTNSDVSLQQTVSSNIVGSGNPITYTITVSNKGPAKATGVKIIDTLAPGVTFNSYSASQGSCAENYGVVDCNLGSILSGRTANVRIQITLLAKTTTKIRNLAVVVSSEVDPDPTNNTSFLDSVVLPARAEYLEITGLDSPVVAGQANRITVTAKSASESIAINYAGTVHFSATDSRASLPSNYTFTAGDNGTHTFTTPVVFRTAGEQTISVTDTQPEIRLSGSQITTVQAGPASQLIFSGLASTVTAGAQQAFTVTAADPFGNTDRQYSGVLRFTSTDPAASLPADYTLKTADGGKRSFSLVLKTAGTQTITVTGNTAALPAAAFPDQAVSQAQILGTISITVNAAAPSQLEISAVPDTITAGTASDLRVTAKDPYGNIATGYTGGVRFTATDSKAILPSDYAFGAADKGSHLFTNGLTLKTAGTQTITATDIGVSTLTGSKQVKVNPGPISGLRMSGIPDTLIAGTPSNVTVAATDAFGNNVPTYAGTVRFTSTDSNAALPADYAFTLADAGTHTFSSGVILRTAGTRTVTVTDTAQPSLTNSLTAIVNPAAPSVLVLSGITSPITAGTAYSLTVRIQDAFGNVVPSYTGTIRFTATDSRAVLPQNYTFTSGDAGVHTFSQGVSFRTAGPQTLTVADIASAALSATLSFTVNPGPIVGFRLIGLSTAIAGTPQTVSVETQDAYGNLIPSYTGTIRFNSTDSNALLPQNYTFTTADAGRHTFTGGVTLRTAGGISVTVSDVNNPALTTSQTVTINPGAAASLVLSGISSPVPAGASSTVAVRANDAYGNAATGYTGTVRFTATDKSAVLPPNYTFTAADAGIHSFPGGVSLRTLGTQTVTVTDIAQSSLSGSQTVTVVVGSAAAFAITGLPTSTTAGTQLSFTIQVTDAFGNVVTGYTGTARFTSSDPAATLPGNYTFTGADAGTRAFPNAIVLRTSGSQSVTVSDVASPAISGSRAVTVNPGLAVVLAVTGLASPVAAGTPITAAVRAVDSFGNTATGYTGTVRFTSSDSNAVLPRDYTFTAADGGSGTFGGIILRTAGAQSVTARDLAAPSITGSQSVTVVAGAAATLILSGVPASTSSGTPFSASVQARDSFGNLAAGYTGTVRFTSTDSSATLPANYTFTAADAGNHTFAGGITLRTPGNQTVTVADTVSAGLTSTQGATVIPNVPVSFQVAGIPASIAGGTPATVSVTAIDAVGNPSVSYTGTIRFSSTGSGDTLPANYTFTLADAGRHTFSNGVTPGTFFCGNWTVFATDIQNQSLAGSQTVLVTGSPVTLSMIISPSPLTAGAGATVTVTARDSCGNPALGYRGTIRFSSGDEGATLPADYTFTGADGGTHAFTGVILRTAGNQTVSAFDLVSTFLFASQSVLVVPGAPASLSAIPRTTAPLSGTPFDMIVIVFDAYGNVVTGYNRAVQLTSSDASFSMSGPNPYTFVVNDNGSHTFTVTLVAQGSQTITITDSGGLTVTVTFTVIIP